MLERQSALWIFVLETHVNYGTRVFTFGKALYKGNVDYKSRTFKCPLDITIIRTSSDNSLIGNYNIVYDKGIQTMIHSEDWEFGSRKIINVDWLDIVDDYTP